MYLTIISGRLEVHQGVLRDVQEIYKIVGGFFDHSSIRVKDKILTVYCYEYALHEMEPNVYIPQLGQIFNGPLVIDVADSTTGETISMTEEETSRIKLVSAPGYPVPVLMLV